MAVFGLEDISPLWLCPLRAPPAVEGLAPAGMCKPGEIAYNIGVYGTPNQRPDLLLMMLEGEMMGRGGRKMLYAHTLLTEDRFWLSFRREEYDAARDKYHCRNAFLGLYKKSTRAPAAGLLTGGGAAVPGVSEPVAAAAVAPTAGSEQ